MDDATIRRAANALIDATPAPARVVLLEQPDGSDRMFVVVVDEITDRAGEMARLDRILRRLLIPADVAVLTEAEMHRRHDLGALLRELTIRGRIIPEP